MSEWDEVYWDYTLNLLIGVKDGKLYVLDTEQQSLTEGFDEFTTSNGRLVGVNSGTETILLPMTYYLIRQLPIEDIPVEEPGEEGFVLVDQDTFDRYVGRVTLGGRSVVVRDGYVVCTFTHGQGEDLAKIIDDRCNNVYYLLRIIGLE